MSDLVLIKSSGASAPETAQKLLDAAKDPSEVRTATGGFVVTSALAKKAGLLEDSGSAAGSAPSVNEGETEADTGFTTSTETGPSPEGQTSDTGNATPDAPVRAGDSAKPSDAARDAKAPAKAANKT